MNRDKRRILYLCVLTYTVSYLCRTNLSLAMEPLKSSLGASELALSLISTLYFWMYAAGQLVGGYLATRINPRKLIMTGLVLTGAFNTMVGVSSSIYAITIFWALNGISLAMFWPSIVQICSQKFSRDEYSRITMIMNYPTTMGYFISWLALGNMAHRGYWRPLFIIPAVLAAVFFFVWLLSGANTDDARCAGTDESRSAAGFRATAGLFMNRTILAFALIVMLEGAARESMNLWAPTLIADRMNGNTNLLSVFLSLIPLFTTAGLITAKHYMKNMDVEKNTVAWTVVIMTVIFVIMMYISRDSFVLFLLFYAMSLSAIYAGASFIVTLVPFRIADTGKSALISGVLNFMAYIGASLGILISGFVSSHWGWDAIYMLWIAFSAIPLLLLPAIRKKQASDQGCHD